MGDHVKPQEDIDIAWYWDTEDSSCPQQRLNDSCEDLECDNLDDNSISKANWGIINWMVNEYWEKKESQIEIINKKVGLFEGNIKQKHAALHKACSILAKNYYRGLRTELEDVCHKYCSTKTLDELKNFNSDFIFKEFKEIYFNTPKTTAIWLEEKECLKEAVENTLLKRIAFLTKTEESWLKEVHRQQYEYFEAFTLMATDQDGCYWIEIEKKDDRLMELIGYTVYKKTYRLAEYSEEELHKIMDIAEQIRSKSYTDIIKLSFIFIIYQLKDKDVTEPVFRISNPQSILFVDINQRVYSCWDDFEANNKLAECIYFYPFKGEYNSKVGFHVTFSWSPASYASKKVIGVLDVVGKVMTLGSAAALGAAAALHAAPIVAVGGAAAAVASGAYGVNRGIVKILDKVSHKQNVNTQDVVNVMSNAVSMASGGVAKVIPALATVGSSMLFTQSAVQGLAAITALVPEDESNIITPESSELPMKTLLFFNSKSAQQAFEKIKKRYDLTADKSTFFVMKTFVLANCVESSHTGVIQKYISNSLASLVIRLLDAACENKTINYTFDVTDLENFLNDNEFGLLNYAFADASERERTEFHKLLMSSVFNISFLWVTSVALRGYRGVEFHPVLELFECMDFIMKVKGISSSNYWVLNSLYIERCKFYINEVLSVIIDEVENKKNFSLNLRSYSDQIKLKSPEILTASLKGGPSPKFWGGLSSRV